MPRVIPEHKMWFNPARAGTRWTGVHRPTPMRPTRVRAAKPTGREAASSKGAPLKEAEAIVPKLELPKAVVVLRAQVQTSSISHNL